MHTMLNLSGQVLLELSSEGRKQLINYINNQTQSKQKAEFAENTDYYDKVSGKFKFKGVQEIITIFVKGPDFNFGSITSTNILFFTKDALVH